VAAIANNYRCVSDKVIDAIAGTGGVIGITAVNDFHVRGRGNTGKVPHVGIDAHIDQYEEIPPVNRTGFLGDFIPWKRGWSHGREQGAAEAAEVSGGVA
jgi:microsomal dipeptidase-like Zn-dependent dipeptidase